MMMLKPPEGALPTDDAAAPSHWRQAPFNLQAEQALLGALLLNNDVLARVDDIVVPADFYEPLHAEIFSTASAMIGAGRVASPVTIRAYFETAEPINETLTVPQYLGRLAISATTIINARDYARTIHDLATRRRLIHIGEDIVNAAYDNTVEQPPDALIEEAERELCALAERSGQGDEVVSITTAMDEAIERIEAGIKRGGGMAGLSSGLIDLDRLLGGFEDDCLYIGAGRPGMGKTAYVVGLARHISKQGIPVHFYSLEMPRYQVANRILSAETGIDGDNIRRGKISDKEFRKIVEARNHFNAHLTIDHRGGMTIGQIMARARRIKRQNGTRFIIIDYLQLMAASADNRVGAITEITTGLKSLAKELHVPILALSQLSRAVETRQDKRPMLSDLRESGSIEQDADAVMFMFREEYYHEQIKPPETDLARYMEWQQKQRQVANKAEIIVSKSRSGPTGIVEVMFDGPTTTFSNLAKTQHMEGYHG